jgi:hypothetical protein
VVSDEHLFAAELARVVERLLTETLLATGREPGAPQLAAVEDVALGIAAAAVPLFRAALGTDPLGELERMRTGTREGR